MEDKSSFLYLKFLLYYSPKCSICVFWKLYLHVDILCWKRTHILCTILQVFATFNDRTLHCPRIVTAARKAYNKRYKAEIELNETFHRFVSNYRLAYQGPNTAPAQVGAKFDTSE